MPLGEPQPRVQRAIAREKIAGAASSAHSCERVAADVLVHLLATGHRPLHRRAAARPGRRSRRGARRTSRRPGCPSSAFCPRRAPTWGSPRRAACRAARRARRGSVRNAPAVTASTTSLTVTPNAFFTALTSASDDRRERDLAVRRDRAVHREARRGERHRGAASTRRAPRRDDACARPPRSPHARWPSAAAGARCDDDRVRRAARCRSARDRAASSAAATSRCSGGIGLEVERGSRASSTPDTPSIAEWCTLAMIATRSVLEALRRPTAPTAAGERSSGRPAISADERGELARAAGRGQRGAAHVVVEVEVGILDPQRVVQAERHRHEPAPERRQQVRSAPAAGRAPGRRSKPPGTVDGSRIAALITCMWCRRRLEREKGGIEAGEASRCHGAGQSPHPRSGRMKAWMPLAVPRCSASSGSASRSTRSGPSAGRSASWASASSRPG